MSHPRPRQLDGRVHGVVLGCQREDGRWLLIRRSAFVAAPGKVCFPGGAIEAGESQADAAAREMREELGVEIALGKRVWRWLSPADLTLWGYRATLVSAQVSPDPAEVAQTLWLTADEARDHPDAMPNNRDFLAALAADIEWAD